MHMDTRYSIAGSCRMKHCTFVRVVRSPCGMHTVATSDERFPRGEDNLFFAIIGGKVAQATKNM